MSNVAADSLVGTTLGGKYAIEALIGLGAMGAVYRAHQNSLHKTVAIKVLHRPLADQPAFVERFQREAFSASQLDHPNSLRVLDFGQTDGHLYLVMEFAQGEDLLTVMARDWPISDRRIVDVISQALAALAAAHDIGIVHRDLKPENILLLHGTDDEGKPTDLVKVCDFGIAKLMGSVHEKNESFSRHLTTEGFVIGTPDYMSPEQARGEEIDGRSDLYAIGVVLYQLLVGKLPFMAETPLGVVLRHISDPPPLPSTHTKVHARLEAICMRALSKDRSARFENAREMRRALRAALGGDEPVAIIATPAPMGRSTDMTSVPVSTPTPLMAAPSRMSRVARLLRPPATTGGRVAAVAAIAVGFAGFSFFVRYLSTRGTQASAVLVTSPEAVLSVPSLPPDPTAGPVAPPPIAIQPEGTTERRTGDRRSDPSPSSDRRRDDKSSTRSSAGTSALRASAAGTESAPITSPHDILPQPSSPPSAETVARSGDNPSPAPSDPGRATPEPAKAPPPPIAEPVAPGVSAVDPARASVAIAAISTTGGISASKVRVALARIPFTSCYRKALANRTSAAPMESSLQIRVDMGGRVTGATFLGDGGLSGLRSCIEADARTLTIRDVDTGDGSAVVTLTFSPR